MICYKRLFILVIFLVLGQSEAISKVDSPWHGVYAGGSFGAAWGLLNNNLSVVNNTAPLFYSPSISGVNNSGSHKFHPLRFMGGAEIGYNKELSSNWLTGLEVSYGYISLSETVNKVYKYANSPTNHYYSFHDTASASQIGTLRLRLGHHYSDYLPYVTAGGAITDLDYQQRFFDYNYGISNLTNYSKVRCGWTIGTGVEYLPTKIISFKLEYLYNNFGKVNIEQQFLGNGSLSGLGATFSNSLKNISIQTLSLGINMHF